MSATSLRASQASREVDNFRGRPWVPALRVGSHQLAPGMVAPILRVGGLIVEVAPAPRGRGARSELAGISAYVTTVPAPHRVRPRHAIQVGRCWRGRANRRSMAAAENRPSPERWRVSARAVGRAGEESHLRAARPVVVPLREPFAYGSRPDRSGFSSSGGSPAPRRDPAGAGTPRRRCSGVSR
jgi:hypothetical protein